MAEYSTSKRFIVRIYRIDTDNCHNIKGMVELLDGSGDQESFSSLTELGAVLKSHSGGRKKIRNQN